MFNMSLPVPVTVHSSMPALVLQGVCVARVEVVERFGQCLPCLKHTRALSVFVAMTIARASRRRCRPCDGTSWIVSHTYSLSAVLNHSLISCVDQSRFSGVSAVQGTDVPARGEGESALGGVDVVARKANPKRSW